MSFAPHGDPDYCHHRTLTSPACNCPCYEAPEGGSGETNPPCDLCEHPLSWHVPRLHFSFEAGRAIKAQGGEAHECCKATLKYPEGAVDCPCPVFVQDPESAQLCANCTHKKGWHRWKDSQGAQPSTPLSPAVASPSSYTYSPLAQHFNQQLPQSSDTYQPQHHPHTPYGSFGTGATAPQHRGSVSSGGGHSPFSPSTPTSPNHPSTFPLPPPAQYRPATQFIGGFAPLRPQAPPATTSSAARSYPHEEPNSAGPSSTSPFPHSPVGSEDSLDDDIVRPRLDKGKSVDRDPPPAPPSLAHLHISSPSSPVGSATNNTPFGPSPTDTSRPSLDIPLAPGHPNLQSTYSFSGVRAPEDGFYGPEPVQPVPPLPTHARPAARPLPLPRRREGSLPSERVAPPVPPSRRQTLETTTANARSPVADGSVGAFGGGAAPARPGVAVATRPAPPSSPPVAPYRTPTSPLANATSGFHTAPTTPTRLAEGAAAANYARPTFGREPVEEIEEIQELGEDGRVMEAFWGRDQQQQELERERRRRESVSTQGSAGGNSVVAQGALQRNPSILELPARQPAGPAAPAYEEYETKGKNVTFAVSPPLQSGRFHPRQVFHLKLILGPKFSLVNFDKIEISLVGNSIINSEPPDPHDFLLLTKSVVPLSHDVQTQPGERVFMWSMTMPAHQNCKCRPENDSLPLPPSLGHPYFSSRYFFRVMTKKKGRLLGTTSVTDFPFRLDAPFFEIPNLIPSPSIAGVTRGVDGPWHTTTNNRIIRVDNQQAAIVSQELAYQIIYPPAVPSVATPPGTTPTVPKPKMVHIPYRISLNLGAAPNPLPLAYLINQEALDKFSSTVRLALSRKITIFNSGSVPAGGRPNNIRDLPTLLVTFKDRRDRSYFTVVDGRTIWRCEGLIEVAEAEGKSLSTCNVTVRYLLTAKALATCGFSHPVEIYARNVNLEIETANPAVNPDLPAPIVRTASTNSANSDRSVASLLVQPTPFDHRRTPSLTAFTPMPPPSQPVASGSGTTAPVLLRPGVTLQDGRRPPSIAGSSFFRGRYNDPAHPDSPTDSDEGSFEGTAVPGQWPAPLPPAPPAPPSAASSNSGDPPDLLPARHSGPLDLPPDFEMEFPEDHEAAPLYTLMDGVVDDEDMGEALDRGSP